MSYALAIRHSEQIVGRLRQGHELLVLVAALEERALVGCLQYMEISVNVELEAEHELFAVVDCGTAKPDLVIQVGVDLRVVQ